MSYKSILDNDFYKFTMQYAVVKLYPDTLAKYEFINRGAHEFPPGFAEALKERISEMSKLALTREEKEYLRIACPYRSEERRVGKECRSRLSRSSEIDER